ncbi:hypothetical protein TrCOL_g8914 [Triparma columacea]|uniref:Uncharacterized protein n=1 Tax=Triparma columacea TaxID=722753 RepID=A0A9W7GQA9_9STRA|nr:hypothetical protein TrCOL_g8914 [Triparma columacea]
MPRNHLVPPVPNRASYIKWIEAMLGQGNSADGNGGESNGGEGNGGRTVLGLDLGTGASAIYPLLGCGSNDNWSFLASEIDKESVENAREIVKRNGLEGRIEVLDVGGGGGGKVGGPIRMAFEKWEGEGEKGIDFVMTNPPFYGSEEEARETRLDGRERTEMSSSESVTEGGEVGFVGRMIEDSLGLMNGVKHFTAMLSRRGSLNELVKLLKDRGVGKTCIKTTEFRHGNVVRFGLAWNFEDCVKVWEEGGGEGGPIGDMRDRVMEFFSESGTGGSGETVVGEDSGVEGVVTVTTDTWEGVVSTRPGSAKVVFGLKKFSGQEGKKGWREVCERMEGEIYRTSRKWRRKLGKKEKRKEDGEGGKGDC